MKSSIYTRGDLVQGVMCCETYGHSYTSGSYVNITVCMCMLVLGCVGMNNSCIKHIHLCSIACHMQVTASRMVWICLHIEDGRERESEGGRERVGERDLSCWWISLCSYYLRVSEKQCACVGLHWALNFNWHVYIIHNTYVELCMFSFKLYHILKH